MKPSGLGVHVGALAPQLVRSGTAAPQPAFASQLAW
jgi:hypothetical protein